MKINYLKQFQAANGLVADGVMGKNTATALMKVLGIVKPIQAAHFIGQMAVESNHFTAGRENLNYSADGIMDTFCRGKVKRFTMAESIAYARQPERIANRAYANRNGNRSESSGDGWRNRGVGSMQLTFANNIRGYFDYVGLPLDTDPNEILKPEHYFRSGKYYFDRENLWGSCIDTSDRSILAVSRGVNLGNIKSTKTPNGLNEREDETRFIAKALGVK